jgi:hypothetical protein
VKCLRWFVILVILGLSSSVALADSIDPALGVSGGTGSTLWTGSFTFTINNNTASCDGPCNFTSGAFFINSGSITNFDFRFDTQQGPFSPLTGSAFPIVTTIVPGFEALLSGGTISPLSACIDCSNGTQIGNQIFGDFIFKMFGVVNGSTVTVTSNVPVPEPGTLILMVSGFAAIGLNRLRKKARA